MDTDDLTEQFVSAYLNRFLVLVVSESKTCFQTIQHILSHFPHIEIEWSDAKIQGLSYLFMKKPNLLIVALDTNPKTLEFIRLARNNKLFTHLPVFTLFNQPLTLGQKLKRLNIAARFTYPIDRKQLIKQVEQLMKKQF